MPVALVTADLALLSKGEGNKPIQQRPVTLYSVVYRAYAGARYEQTQQWQNAWEAEGIYGGMKGREAYDDTLDLALELEQALIWGTELNICLLDNSKFFDNFAWKTISPLAEKLGAPRGLVRMARTFYSQAKRRFRIADSYGPVFTPTNGIGQGCALSLRWANVAAIVWLRMLDFR